MEKIRPQLTSNGGNVFMLQIENEYSGGGGAGGHDQEYLDWAVDMASTNTTPQKKKTKGKIQINPLF